MAEVVKVLEVKAPIGLHYDGYDVIREREGDLQVEKGGVGNEGKQAQEGEGEGEKQEQTNTNTNKLKHDEHKSKIKSEIKQKRRMYIGSRSKKEGESGSKSKSGPSLGPIQSPSRSRIQGQF